MSSLIQVKQNLEQLAIQASQLDRQRGEHHQPLFDQTLFHCQARLLVPCVKEAESTYHTLAREQESGRLTTLRAEYLSEQLLAQISAIQRELATYGLRNSEPKHRNHYRKPINVLYQELAQHQEWERRLQDMVREKEQQLSLAAPYQQQDAQKALIATEQRLARCQQAKLKLEKQITYREKDQ